MREGTGVETMHAGDLCPRCGRVLASVLDAPAWCPSCEWRLALFEPEVHRDRVGWSRVDAWLYRLAYRRTAKVWAGLDGRTPARPRWNAARVVSNALALLVHVVVVAWFAFGVYVCTLGFPSVLVVAGAAVVAIAVQMWPRPGRLPRDATVLERTEAPALRALVGRVAAAVGAPAPRVICVDDRYSADSGTFGLFHQRYLRIGLPLWYSLSGSQRVALLGHQLAHFVNGDPRRGVLTGATDASLRKVIELFSQGRDRRLRTAHETNVVDPFTGMRTPATTGPVVGLVWLSEMVWRPVAAVLGGAAALLRFTLNAVQQRDGQRAEYYADALAARAGGSTATVQLLDLLVVAAPVLLRLQKQARAGEPISSWQTVAGRTLAEGSFLQPLRRQLGTRRENSVFATHPPLGMRARMVESRPPVPAAVVLDDEDGARIDVELAGYARPVARALALG
jgi:heat shock protein HtpX